MPRVVLKRDRAAQKHFFAALRNDTKGKDRDTINAFRRWGGAIEVQFFERLNRPILTNRLCNRLFVSSFLWACALSASRRACWLFINDLADFSVVLAAFSSKFAGLYNNLRRSFYCLPLRILRMKLKQWKTIPANCKLLDFYTRENSVLIGQETCWVTTKMSSKLTLLIKKSLPIDREAISAQFLRLGQPPKWHQVKELRNGH